MASYQKLCTEFYDLSKPQACPVEVAFFSKLLKEAKGPLLEAMCGSGRLSIPLLKAGHIIDGVDNSESMLTSCQRRCAEQHLLANLTTASLQSMNLNKKYGMIFIAVGSFQLIHDRTEALQVLKVLYEHLLPGGSLVLDTFIPWESLKQSIVDDAVLAEAQPYSGNRKVFCPDGAEIRLKTTEYSYPLQQVEKAICRYEKWKEGKMVEKDDEEIIVRWYYRYEMELFLQKVGLENLRIYDNSFEHNSSSTVYQAYKRKTA